MVVAVVAGVVVDDGRVFVFVDAVVLGAFEFAIEVVTVLPTKPQAPQDKGHCF